mmetsp:Transcript_2801/g.5658  ORF Transcript_2801/g.5658 Transcript_2801/m.5658 type:complete len:91 (+) Transcript_2801:437-709(+)
MRTLRHALLVQIHHLVRYCGDDVTRKQSSFEFYHHLHCLGVVCSTVLRVPVKTSKAALQLRLFLPSLYPLLRNDAADRFFPTTSFEASEL